MTDFRVETVGFAGISQSFPPDSRVISQLELADRMKPTTGRRTTFGIRRLVPHHLRRLAWSPVCVVRKTDRKSVRDRRVTRLFLWVLLFSRCRLLSLPIRADRLRERLNLKLVIGLFVGTLVTAVGAYVVHGFSDAARPNSSWPKGQRLHQEAKELAKQPTKKRSVRRLGQSGGNVGSLSSANEPGKRGSGRGSGIDPARGMIPTSPAMLRNCSAKSIS